LNFVEAIKLHKETGKRFKRPGHARWWDQLDSDELRQDESTEALFLRSQEWGRMSLRSTDVLAEDWRVEEPTIEISARDFWEACRRVMVDTRSIAGYEKMDLVSFYECGPLNGADSPIKKLAKELGLESL
jgi:hypothetical protein